MHRNSAAQSSHKHVHHNEVTETRSYNSCLPGSPDDYSNGTTNGLLSAPKQPIRRCRSASPLPSALPRLTAITACTTTLLSADQQTLIRRSWLKIPKTSDGLGHAIYQQMTARYAGGVRELFPTDDPSAVRRHERYFVDLIQSAVDNLVDLEHGLRPWLERIGKGHSEFSIRSTHWDCFGEALTVAVCSWLGSGKAKRRETIRAWQILGAFIADRLASTAHRNSYGVPCPSPRIQLLTLVTDGLPSTPP